MTLRLTWILLTLFLLGIPPCVVTATPSDDFLLGYVAAVLDREFSRPNALVAVAGGEVFLDPHEVPEPDRAWIGGGLLQIDGVREVRWENANARPDLTSRPVSRAAAPRVAQTDPTAEGVLLLPDESLWEPLTGDPRWPRFAASYLEFRDDSELNTVGSVAFGGLLPIVQGDAPLGGRWEVALQGAVFSIFDLDRSSNDLVNSDFFVGVPLTLRWGGLSLTTRAYHQSSHLGDEFLLRTDAERVNISFEAVDAMLSLDVSDWSRLYGGGGYLIDREPDSLGRKYVQAGVELTSPWAWGGWLRPIAVLDAQRREEPDWDTDYSVRAGVQIENARLEQRRLQLLAEYYKGRNPNGQFFDRRIEYWGLGLHLHY